MATTSKRTQAQPKAAWSNPWHASNYALLGGGIAVIVVGFLLLAMGISAWDNPLAVDVAPVVLVVGYCVIIPLAIMRSRGTGS